MNAMINTAVKAARKAANMMLRASLSLESIKVETKSFNDFVSQVDRESESIIIDTLLHAYPDHKIRAEEGGVVGQEDSDYEWIIDPLDGTTNYLHGHPQYAISIALACKGIVTEAVVFDIERNNIFTASRGKGAFLNDRRIRVSKRINLNECLIATGFPVVDQSMMDTYLSILKDMLAKTAGARREGAASLDLCNVACGRVDGFFEFNLKPWDIAAGSLLVQEAGGIVTDFKGNDTWLETGDIVAANPKVLAQMLAMIAKQYP
ncbi:inositol monophosphatase family protein [Neisseria sp. Ec49-e6-T10]|uniref:inositol monophosphatase family protein n=1 Tax=Neisseria sp. Ec49-e6-T10 TaxID=3140744 RepID=UPI003EBCD169